MGGMGLFSLVFPLFPQPPAGLPSCMHGNVREWCLDRYDRGYYGKSPRRDPGGPDGGTSRVLRGGAWNVPGEDCRAARRLAVPPHVRDDSFGFRMVLAAGGP